MSASERPEEPHGEDFVLGSRCSLGPSVLPDRPWKIPPKGLQSVIGLRKSGRWRR